MERPGMRKAFSSAIGGAHFPCQRAGRTRTLAGPLLPTKRRSKEERGPQCGGGKPGAVRGPPRVDQNDRQGGPQNWEGRQSSSGHAGETGASGFQSFKHEKVTDTQFTKHSSFQAANAYESRCLLGENKEILGWTHTNSLPTEGLYYDSPIIRSGERRSPKKMHLSLIRN